MGSEWVGAIAAVVSAAAALLALYMVFKGQGATDRAIAAAEATARANEVLAAAAMRRDAVWFVSRAAAGMPWTYNLQNAGREAVRNVTITPIEGLELERPYTFDAIGAGAMVDFNTVQRTGGRIRVDWQYENGEQASPWTSGLPA